MPEKADPYFDDPPVNKEHQALVDALTDADNVSDWEHEFLANVKIRLRTGRPLTSLQAGKLTQIYDKRVLKKAPEKKPS